MKFTDLDLHPDLQSSLARAGFVDLTPIQADSIGPVLAGQDVVGVAQTGTGKTLAFLVPIIQKIYAEKPSPPVALIITPTRELCIQIAEEAVRLLPDPGQVATIYGGEGYGKQEDALARSPSVIVATPGRLIDFLKQKKITTQHLGFLILDEADRMFDMGFLRDVRFIMRHMPENVRVMLFSATMSYYVMRLASDYLKNPVEVRVASDTVAVEAIEQSLLHLGREEKLNYLINQILSQNVQRGIVFTNLKNLVPRLVNALRRYGIAATGISSRLEQNKRIQLLKRFKLGKYSILVATDVASRGLDIDDVTHVFNYDLPQDSESYVHRIGRTARAGKTGMSISYCSELDYENLPRIERLLKIKIPVTEIDPVFLKPPAGEFTPFDDGTVYREISGREERFSRDRDSRQRRSGERNGRGQRGRGREDKPREGQTAALPVSGERSAYPPGKRPALDARMKPETVERVERPGDRPADPNRKKRRRRRRGGGEQRQSDSSERMERDRPERQRQHANGQGREAGQGRESGQGRRRRRRRGGQRQEKEVVRKGLFQKIIGFFKRSG
ncbi:MAG: DEAD/DEAH box helicase [Spirochaetales bacterium]|nr:DEAD/DEAH box helicase [Spirochaetales bacterium]